MRAYTYTYTYTQGVASYLLIDRLKAEVKFQTQA